MKFTTDIYHPNVYEDGSVCISILHPPGDDEFGYEKAAERWNPIHTVESIILSVITMLADPNDESPANLDVASSSSAWMTRFARSYRRWAGIHRYGLQYEDLLVETAAVDEALRRLPHAALVARDQRIKRAFDLSHKKIYLPVHQQSDPLRQTHIVRNLVKEVQQEFDERAAFRK